VPVRDLRLAELPAEIDLLAVAHRRKVEQAQVNVLDDAAEPLDAVDEPHDLALALAVPRRRKGRAHPGQARGRQFDFACGRALFEQRDREVAALGEEFLDQGRDARNQGICAIERKGLHAVETFPLIVTSERVIFLTGLSGSGKSQTMKTFEDLGFYCVDNLPPALAGQTLALLDEARATKVAIALDVRSGGPLGDALAAIDAVGAGRRVDVLFLDARDDVLVRRYSETRRRHPFASQGTLREAIAVERSVLSPLRERATHELDTTGLTHAALKQRIFEAFSEGDANRLAVSIEAFGYKFGVPLDADLLFDVRFLCNPQYDDDLRPLTGTDPAVAAYIEADPHLEPFLAKLFDLVAFLIPRYIGEGKTQLTIAIGCTGGRHRSVYVARRLAEHLDGDARIAQALDLRDATR